MPTARPKRKKKSSIKRTDKKQSERFVAVAKELGADKSGAAFERAMDALTSRKERKEK